MLLPVSIFLLLVAGILGFLYFSPWPAVWLLRSGKDSPPGQPVGYEEQIRGITVNCDLSYPSDHEKNQFDLYLPKEKSPAPLVVWVHGGAFVAGDKSGIRVWASLLASQGYAVAAMNYEWAPEAAWPAQVNQTAACLEELRRLSAEEGVPVDMTRVFLAGDSAGAHIAMQEALACVREDFSKETGICAALKKEELKGVLLYCGPYELEAFSKISDPKLRYFMNKIGQSYLGMFGWADDERAAYLNIIPFLSEDCPPVYITDGNSGSFEQQGKNLGEALRKLEVPVTERYFLPENGTLPHEYQMQLETEEAGLCYQDTLEFLKANSGSGIR